LIQVSEGEIIKEISMLRAEMFCGVTGFFFCNALLPKTLVFSWQQLLKFVFIAPALSGYQILAYLSRYCLQNYNLQSDRISFFIT
jgi:hypothetical protein